MNTLSDFFSDKYLNKAAESNILIYLLGRFSYPLSLIFVKLRITPNQITTISSGIFNGLTSLIKLDLSNNQITTIEPGTFNGITLKLDGNFIDLNSLTNINNENDDG